MNTTSPARPLSSNARAIPRPDIVDSSKVRMSVEQALRLSIASLEVIEIFPQLHDHETGEVLSKNMPKSHLSLFMTTIAEAVVIEKIKERGYPSNRNEFPRTDR